MKRKILIEKSKNNRDKFKKNYYDKIVNKLWKFFSKNIIELINKLKIFTKNSINNMIIFINWNKDNYRNKLIDKEKWMINSPKIFTKKSKWEINML